MSLELGKEAVGLLTVLDSFSSRDAAFVVQMP